MHRSSAGRSQARTDRGYVLDIPSSIRQHRGRDCDFAGLWLSLGEGIAEIVATRIVLHDQRKTIGHLRSYAAEDCGGFKAWKPSIDSPRKAACSTEYIRQRQPGLLRVQCNTGLQATE
jgi:hypothetical protein